MGPDSLARGRTPPQPGASTLLSLMPEGSEELRQRYIQRRRDLTKGHNPGAALAALDATDIVPMQIGTGGEFFLRNL